MSPVTRGGIQFINIEVYFMLTWFLIVKIQGDLPASGYRDCATKQASTMKLRFMRSVDLTSL